MSPAFGQSFLVKGFDYEEWHIIVQALNKDDAIAKAEAIYLTDNFGNTDAVERCRHDFGWTAEPLVPEVQQ